MATFARIRRGVVGEGLAHAPICPGAFRGWQVAQHPGLTYACTVGHICRAIRKLAAVATPEEANSKLWRGVRDRDVTPEFLMRGGTELGFMSTTGDRRIAEAYATRGGPSFSLLFKLNVLHPLQCGADIIFASVFPNEVEYLYPPGTLLQSKRSVHAALGISRGTSRGEGLAAAPGQAESHARQLKVVDVVPLHVAA